MLFSIADEFPEYKLVIYDQGVLEDELRAQIKSLNLEDRNFIALALLVIF